MKHRWPFGGRVPLNQLEELTALSQASSWISYIREQKAGVEGEGMPREGGRAR